MCIQVTSDVAYLQTYKNIKPLSLPGVGGGGVLPYKGLMGTCGQPGYFFSEILLPKLKKTIKKTTLDNLPSTLDILASTLDKNLHSKSTYFLKLTHQEKVMEVKWFVEGKQSADAHEH